MKFKDETVRERFYLLHPSAVILATEMDTWARDKHGIELTITAAVSTLAEDKELGRTSDTHRTCRAFDVRTRDIPDAVIAELCSYFRKKYDKKLGAVQKNQANLIVYKPHGTGPHLHVQLKRKYARISGLEK